ncbi:MAG: ATP-binding protein, partial [Clostridia bacterium]|nr:ATP-binding protein [Clostridia bacterium]
GQSDKERPLFGPRINLSHEEREAMYRERVERECAEYNAGQGYLDATDGIDCPLCKNRGYVAKAIKHDLFGYWTTVMAECECKKQRTSVRRIKASGLAGAISRCTFDTFEAMDDWQIRMKSTAQRYVNGNGGLWFYAGGQIGAGKTHICTAICGELLKQNQSVLYMLWKDESTRLKSLVNDTEVREREIGKYKSVDVLYIDDFFKSQRSGGKAVPPTPADLSLAFEILNHRYVARKKTVISSEWMISEICDIDEAVGSRIYEMSKGSCCQISRDKTRNFRTREVPCEKG